MIRRFLEYSLHHGRPVKIIFLSEKGVMQAKNITVCALDEQALHYRCGAGGKKPKVLPLDSILSASYARGDSGDTLTENNEKEPE